MRAAIDARILDRPAFAERGIGRYTQALLDALVATGRDVVATRTHRRTDADVLHAPSIDCARLAARTPHVVTVHDLVPLKHPERYLRTGIRHRIRYAATKRATRLIVPTNAVAHDCERLLSVDRGRIDVIGEAPAPVFREVADLDRLLHRFKLPSEFVLWVGGLDPPDPRKGIERLAAAVRNTTGPPLVLAGRVGPEAAALATADRVQLIGRATDDELAALYSAATALVLPSEEEGFGLTAMEALACGTPVAAFAIDAMTEQYANTEGVTLVEPGDNDALLKAATELAGNRPTQPTRTWSDVANETWAAYERAAGCEP